MTDYTRKEAQDDVEALYGSEMARIVRALSLVQDTLTLSVLPYLSDSDGSTGEILHVLKRYTIDPALKPADPDDAVTIDPDKPLPKEATR